MILDYSAQRIPTSPKVKMVGGEPVRFKPGDVTALMIHQTDCFFGSENQTPEWCAKRALKVAAHVVVFRTGLVAVSAPLDWVVNHGNAPNPWCWGIEVEAVAEGCFADPRKRPFKSIPLDQKVGIGRAVCLLATEAHKRGHDLRTILAHRQSSGTRRADPGYEIWPVAVAHANAHNIYADSAFVSRDGRMLPDVWTGFANGVAY
jgi:hypothetical protein